jgi:hypothetical protein
VGFGLAEEGVFVVVYQDANHLMVWIVCRMLIPKTDGELDNIPRKTGVFLDVVAEDGQLLRACMTLDKGLVGARD